MKVYQYTVVVIDFDNVGDDEIRMALTDHTALHVSLRTVKEADIGEWSDETTKKKTINF